MQKRGQLAIFLVLGLVLFIIIGILVFLNLRIKSSNVKTETAKETIYSLDVKEVEGYIQECIKESIKETLEDIYKYSGYINMYQIPYSRTISSETRACLISYDPNLRNNIPVNHNIFLQSNLDINIILKTSICLNNLESTFNQYSISKGSILFNTQLLKNPAKVKIELKHPLKIEKGSITTQISKFSTEVPTELLNIYDLVVRIVNDEASSLINTNGFMSIINPNSYCSKSYDYYGKSIFVECIDSLNERLYKLTDVNQKEFYFGICK